MNVMLFCIPGPLGYTPDKDGRRMIPMDTKEK